MAWYLWLYVIVAALWFLPAYNSLVELAREKQLYWLKPTRVGHLSVIYIMDPFMAALWAALWPLNIAGGCVIGLFNLIRNVRAAKKATSRD